MEFFTDLAVEMAEHKDFDDTSGVTMNVTERGNVKLTHVEVLNDEGARAMQKPAGSYVTIESPSLKENDPDSHEAAAKVLAEELAKLINLKEHETALVIGLGNRFVTPDALGPKVISRLLITRHIMEILPDELMGKVSSLCGMSPGVMGMTGIETAEVVRGLVSRVKPDKVIAIDALAARRIERINTTIQITNTGISPGSGVGNARQMLNEETLGVPTFAIGVPTVASAATFVNDCMEAMISTMLDGIPKDLQDDAELIDMLKSMQNRERQGAIRESLGHKADMFVTPKEVDSVVSWLGGTIALGINMAIHQQLSIEDIGRFVY